MKHFFALSVLLAGIIHSGAAPGTADLRSEAARQETNEKVRRLQAELEDTKALVTSLSQKLEGLSRQMKEQSDAVRRLTDSLRSSQAGNARQSELDGLSRSLREIEKNRKADQAQVVKGFSDLRKLILEMSAKSTRPTPVAQRNSPEPNPPSKPKGTYHTVDKGQTLTAILSAYIDALESKGSRFKLTQEKLLKANPKLDPNLLLVGQEIFIPLED